MYIYNIDKFILCNRLGFKLSETEFHEKWNSCWPFDTLSTTPCKQINNNNATKNNNENDEEDGDDDISIIIIIIIIIIIKIIIIIIIIYNIYAGDNI